MEQMPFTHERRLFEKLAAVTSYSALSPQEKLKYDLDLQAYRDMTNQLDYALEKGREEGRFEVVKSMFENGLSLESISKIVKLSVDKVRKILGV